jgi:hypothetical protein
MAGERGGDDPAKRLILEEGTVAQNKALQRPFPWKDCHFGSL